MTPEPVKKSLQSTPFDCEYAVLGSHEAGTTGEIQVERPVRSRMITVEPLILGITFCQAGSSAVITNLIARQACYSLGGLTPDECQKNATLENEVHRITADIQAINIALSSVVPVAICIFAGPWSDTNGRKPFLNLNVFGHFLYFLLYLAIAGIPCANPLYLTVPSMMLMLTGGPTTFIMLTFCYLSDVSTDQNKTFRMGLGTSGAVLGGCGGPLVVHWLYGDGSPQGFFRVIAMDCFICLLMTVYSCCILPETIVRNEKVKSKLWTWEHCLGILKFLKKKNREKQITIVFLILLVIVECTVILSGESEVLFLTLKKQFHWDIGEFSKFTAFCQALSCFYTSFILWLLCTLLKVSDFATLSGTLVVYATAMVIFANARTIIWVVVANGIGACNRMMMPLYKSMLSKAVDSKEIGTALTIAQIFESLFTALFTAAYAKIYGLVVSHSPLTIYYLSAFFAILGFLTLIVLEGFRRSEARKTLR